MEFYKEGRVVYVAGGSTLDLGAAQYNHKGVMILCKTGNCAFAEVQVKFYDKGRKSGSISMIIGDITSTGTADIINVKKGIIPVRLAEITSTSVEIAVVLLN